MKLKDISRTATFAWDPSTASEPLIVTGAVAGALDDSFSNDSQLEIWAPKFFQSEGKADAQGYSLGGQGGGPDGSVSINSRFNRLAWSQPGATPSGRGVIAAGMETGELYMYDPVKILAKEDAQIYKNDKHSGPIRGLDWNPIQKNLLLSGATNAELYIHDLNNLSSPIPPGTVSTKLNEITSLQWNPSRARVFAASSSSGYSSIWDLGSGKEVAYLQYGGGAAKGDSIGGGAGTQIGKRRGMSDLCWHPTQATRLVTASEDDESPIVMMWDLRNTRAPERILTGHTKGVLSVSWCKQDVDLLASCGKDNRTLIWNPQNGEIVGELPQTGDWAFETAWCPSNPNMLAVASFDGHIALNSLQSTRPKEAEENKFAADATADDIFGALASADVSEDVTNVKSLTQAPKWMLRPCSASWGYGGLLATVSNLPAASGKHQSSVVHLRYVVTEDSIIERAKSLKDISGNKEKLSEFATSKSQDSSWKALQSLFRANSRDELVALLGFSKEEVARQVHDVVKKLAPAAAEEVTVVEPEGEISPKTDKDDKELKTDKPAETKSETSALFTDDAPVTPAETGGETDFFASMATGGPLRNPQLDSVVPHVGQPPDSSVAATAGSGASSVRSESIKDNHFNIYPSGESDTDRLITQALVLGDFKSAVDLCLATERYADALLLAIRGGPELLQSTQKAYFKRRTVAYPFLRVFQSIVTEDLADIVQNADLNEWKVVFVVLCTFAKDADFGNLADQLGRRLHFKWQLLSASDSPEAAVNAKVARQDATLCYLAARNLERVVSIWTNEMQEEEASTDAPRYTAHAMALQSFIEKVTVFQAATGYVDKDLTAQSPENGARPYPLAALYDRFYEYADLLATQGLVDAAAKYVKMTPKNYKGTEGYELDKARSRLLTAAGAQEATTSTASSSAFGSRAKPGATAGRYAPMPAGYTGSPYNTGASPYTSTGPGYGQTASPYQPSYPQTTSAYQPAAPAYPQTSGPYDPSGRRTPTSGYGQPGVSNPYAPAPGANRVASPPTNYGAGYQPATAYGQNGYQPQTQYGGTGYGAPAAPAVVPPPPRVSDSNNPPIVPASQRRDMPGWNDAPSVLVTSKKQGSGSASSTPKPAPITSPFPMSEQSGHGPAPPHASDASSLAAPPRGGPPGVVPPPPKGGPPRPPSVTRNAPPTGGARPPSAGSSPYGQPPQHSPYGQPPQQHSPYGQPHQQQSPYGQPSNPYGQPQMPPQQQHQQHQQHAPQFVPPPPKGGPPPARGSSPRAGPPPPGVVAGPPPARALSPLGPGNRAAQQSMHHGGPPPPTGGPPPPGSRMAGPPPPGRGGPPPPGRQ